MVCFPSSSLNLSPSFIAYDEALLHQLSSSLPLSVDSSLEIPFLLYVTDTLYYIIFVLMSSELQLDIQYSLDPFCKYTRNTSYTYHYVVEDSIVSMTSSSIQYLHPIPSSSLQSSLLSQCCFFLHP